MLFLKKRLFNKHVTTYKIDAIAYYNTWKETTKLHGDQIESYWTLDWRKNISIKVSTFKSTIVKVLGMH